MGEYADLYIDSIIDDYHLFPSRRNYRYFDKRKTEKNMANKEQFIVVRGELYWAKIVGEAKKYTGNPKFDKGNLWSVDVTPNADSRKIIKDAGIGDKLRVGKGEKETRKESFLTLKVLENRPDGKKNKPPKISNIAGQAWDQETEIGNGSIADLKIKVVDYGETQGAYLQEVRVLKHVPFEGGSDGFEPLSEDDEFFATLSEDVDVRKADSSGEAPNADDLDDDIPF